jgi:putative IMPACT (imprinted ancient) family translation regulator
MTYSQNEHINQSFETNAFESTFILVAMPLTKKTMVCNSEQIKNLHNISIVFGTKM